MGILSKIKRFFGNTLYYPGCLTSFALPEIERNYEEILNILGVDFVKLDKLVCCGSPVFNAGFSKDFEKLLKKNDRVMREYGITRMIFNCPSCYSFFKKHYGGDVEFEHVVVTILNNIKFHNIKKLFAGKKVTFHDPCHLGRYENIYEEPRKLLRVLGFEVVEMEKNKHLSMCCGAGGGVRANYTDISRKIADMRVEQGIRSGADFIVTCCPMCYLQLRESANRKNFKVFELSQVVINAIQ